MEKSPVTFNPHRASVMSSRLSYDDLDEFKKTKVDLSTIKALYDRQIKKSLASIPFTLKTSELPRLKNIGFNIGFSVAEAQSKKNTRKQKLKFAKRSEYYVTSHINETAVTIGLREKSKLFTVPSDFDFRTTSPLPDSIQEDNNYACTFNGAITSMENPKYNLNQKSKQIGVFSSLHVIYSDVSQQTKIDYLWPWPWIDNRQNHLSLYSYAAVQDRLVKTLPKKLPYPNPEHTFQRYLESVEPVVTDSQFIATKNVVRKFIKNDLGPLQKKLINDADDTVSEGNWIQKSLPNYDYCYSKEGPVLLNESIIAPFCHDVWPEKPDSMIERAVVLIRLATEFWNLIRTETLKPIQDEKGNVADMTQFLHLFGSTSLPGAQKISKYRFMKTKSEGQTSRHILVAYKGILFVMNVVDKNFQPLPLMEMVDSLKGLTNFVDSEYFVPRDGVNLLTAATDIEIWAEERHRLSKSPKNEQYFNEVDHALFVLSLDHMNVKSLDHVANEAMFGDGCNRWLYKGLNFYVHNNGLVTLNINSRLLDGSTVAFLLHYMHLRLVDEGQTWDNKMAASSNINLPSSAVSLVQFLKSSSTGNLMEEQPKREALVSTDLKMLDFELDTISHDKIFKCAKIFTSISSAVLTSVCKIDDFDCDFFSESTINKDVFAHLALHLTFFRMYFRAASVGTKISIKKFTNVRYDTLRSTNKEVVQWCSAYLDSNVNQETKNKMFWVAHKKQMQLLKECLNGEGYDNHLNALRNHSKIAWIPHEHNMFEDEGFFQSGGGDRYEILAQTLGVGCTACPVFLPCNPKGYGVGYSVAKSFLLFVVSSWKEENVACAPLLAATLKQTCRELIACPPGKPQQQDKTDVFADF